MRGRMLRKIVFFSCAVIVSYNLVAAVASDATVQKVKASKVYSEEALVKNAIEQFNQVLEKKDGHVDRVSCTYEICDNQPVKTSVKTYYSDYHRKPDRSVLGSLENAKPNAILEVTCIKATNTAVVVARDENQKKLSTKSVELS